jgi:hypothetical protein
MFLEIDDKEVKVLTCDWSTGARVPFVDIRHYFRRGLKEDGIAKIKWIPTLENSTGLFSTSLYCPLFKKHVHTHVDLDAYMEVKLGSMEEKTLVN